jgi:hypothetical protein
LELQLELLELLQELLEDATDVLPLAMLHVVAEAVVAVA